MKVKPSIWSITWRYLIVALIVVAAAFGMFFSVFFNVNQETGSISVAPWGVSHYIFVIVMGVSLIGIYIFSIISYYYVIEDKFFTVKRYGKAIDFDYRNIEFIDVDESQRKHQVIFYSTKGRMRYLLGDKKGLLLETLIKKCPKTLTLSEFRRKHPEERY